METIICSGPGPHQPVDGVLGQSSQPNQAPVYCQAPPCQAVAAAAGAQAALQDGNRVTLNQRAQQALTANATFLALAAPTNAQTLAQVQRLTKETNALIRLALSLLSDISDTA